MPESIKIKYNIDSIDIINTTYNDKFIHNINRHGRSKIIDIKYLKNNKELFISKLEQAEKKIRKNYKDFQYFLRTYTFNFFITLSGITKKEYMKFIDRLRKADKNLDYVSIAAWSEKSDLHYHIVIKTILAFSQLKDKIKFVDAKIEKIYDQKKLIGYFGKNLIQDTISILKKVDNEDLIDKQLEILSYSKILNYSKNIKKPLEIKNPSIDELKAISENYNCVKTIKFSKGNSTVRVNKFKPIQNNS